MREDVGSTGGWSFYTQLLPHICAWAGDASFVDAELLLLPSSAAGSVRLPRAHARCLLANAFLLNIRPVTLDVAPGEYPCHRCGSLPDACDRVHGCADTGAQPAACLWVA